MARQKYDIVICPHASKDVLVDDRLTGIIETNRKINIILSEISAAEISPEITKYIAQEASFNRRQFLSGSKNLAKNRTAKVTKPPGARVRPVLEFLYARKTYVRVFEPIFEDMRHEYFEAIQSKMQWHARWIHLRGLLTIPLAIFAHAAGAGGKAIFKAFSAGGS